MDFSSPILNSVILVPEGLNSEVAPDCFTCDSQERKQNTVVSHLGIFPPLKLCDGVNKEDFLLPIVIQTAEAIAFDHVSS